MKKLKTLIVDDDLISVKLIEKRLKNANCEIETARDGTEAVELISQSYFDVVLTDLQMPGDIDGIGVLEAAKRKSARTEVILITAHASVNNAVRAMKKGAADYLQKPIIADELMLRLEKIRDFKTAITNADDLREALDVTEKSASQTIMNLEMKLFQLQSKLFEVNKVLSDINVEASARIRLALEEI